MEDPITVELLGVVPSKKNRYHPASNGKGFFKDSKLQAELDRLALQIPGSVRDIKLESPQIDFYITYVRADHDRDNCVTTILDLLVEYGVLVNDNIKRCNGAMHIWPAEKGEYDKVTVVLTPAIHNEEVQRYVRPQKRRAMIKASPLEDPFNVEDLALVDGLEDTGDLYAQD